MGSVLELAKYVQDQGELGRQQGQQSRLAGLMSKAYTANADQRPSLLADMAATSPDAAVGAQKALGSMDKDTLGQISMRAQQLISAPAAQRAELYRGMPEMAARVGLGTPPADWNDAMLPHMEKLAGMAGGAASGVHSGFIDRDGRVMNRMRDGSVVWTGTYADPKLQLRDHPGMTPELVDMRAGTTAPLVQGGSTPQGAVPTGGALAPGEEVYAVDGQPVPPEDIATIAKVAAAADRGEAVSMPASRPRPAAARPAIAPAEAERLRLAQEANARAAEAAALAKRGTAPAGFRFKEDGSLEAIPGGPKPAGSAATEDERKAAGWLAQASNAFQNMERALQADKDADEPGFIETYSPIDELGNLSRSPTRQQYVQASSSFGEAVLRAATGAGVNKEEAVQKARELTPQRGDSEAVRKQKREALTVYLSSLRQRAGRAAPQAPAAPQVGEVRRGYRYKGGDPAQQTSWEPAR